MGHPTAESRSQNHAESGTKAAPPNEVLQDAAKQAPSKQKWSALSFLIFIVAFVVARAIVPAIRRENVSPESILTTYRQSSNAYERALGRHFGTLFADPAVLDSLKRMPLDSIQGYFFGLSSRGLKRGTDSTVIAAIRVITIVVPDLSSSSCTAMMSGKINPVAAAEFTRRIAILDSAVLDAYVVGVADAVTAELHQSPIPPAASDDQMDQGWARLFALVPASEAVSFNQRVQELGAGNMAHACKTAAQMYGYALQLPESIRVPFLRGMLQSSGAIQP